jgi:hypothetical protein
MWVDPSNHLAIVLLVERFDMPPDGEKELYGAFFRAAVEEFSSSGK